MITGDGNVGKKHCVYSHHKHGINDSAALAFLLGRHLLRGFVARCCARADADVDANVVDVDAIRDDGDDA